MSSAEHARVLRDREHAIPERSHRARVIGVCVRGRDHVGTRRVHCTVERERGGVRGTRALVERSLPRR